MYEIIKNVITSGRYELSDMLKKIDTIWLQGDLTDAEKEELVSIARDKADPENSYAGIEKQLETIFMNMAEMTKIIKSNTERITKLEGGTVTLPETEEYPAYQKPQGAHDAYYTNDKMTYTDGKKYICIAPEGVAVVWSPEEYPAYWQEVTE